ncbi:MAG TPA: hypothetical protein VFU71_16800 [Burkholderiaceae bacterium]|nr:hypothetical protein [Burkholderiaceae bacterium]
MQLIVPFAGVLSEAGRHAAQTLSLPRLEQLLARSHAGAALGTDEHSLSTPHELAIAHALGWPLDDGRLPFAALAAAHDGVSVGTRAVGQLTPVHLHVGTDQVTLTDPAALALDAADARALFDALQPLFGDAGFVLRWGDVQRWYVEHPSLDGLATASLDRVIGRNVDPWLPDARAGRAWQRLASEAQMLLHAHALNARREAAGLAAINSLWLSGCGVLESAPVPAPRIDERLRAPALNEDWAAWAEAWHALDAGPLAALLDAGDDATLTLAGERHALTLACTGGSVWHQLRTWWRRPAAYQVLAGL